MSSHLTKKTIDVISRNIMQTDLIIQNNFKSHQCQHRLILIGTTGNGKSSLANLIIGHKLRIAQNQFDDIILTSSNAKFIMGCSMNPKTTFPNIFYDKIHDILICDPPGFNDNRINNLQDIINAFAINELFTAPCKVSILLVTSGDEMSISGGRGECLREKLELLCQMIPDKQKLKQCLGLVISRPRKSLAKYLESLIYSNNPMIKEWAQFFLNEIDYRVFGFPEPPEIEIGNYYQLNDKEKIIHFVKAASIENPVHKVILSSESMVNLMKIIQNVPKIDEILIELSNMINASIKNVNTQLELTQWECFKDKLKIDNITIPQLITVIQQHIVSPDNYKIIIHKLKYLHRILQFITKIEQLSQMSIDFNINRHVIVLYSQLTSMIEIGKNNLLLKKVMFEKNKLNQQMILLQKDHNKSVAEKNAIQRKLRAYEDKSQFYIRKINEVEKNLRADQEKQIKIIKEAYDKQQQIIENLGSELAYYKNKDRKFAIADCIPVFGSIFKLGWRIKEFISHS